MTLMPPPRSGAPYCVIHCRVSSTKQAEQGESLDVQAELCSRMAADKGWQLAHNPWKESFSGRKSARPVFREVLEFLDSHPGLVQYYLFRSIDRFTRGGSFAYEQMKRELSIRGVEMVDTYGLIQPMRNTLSDLGFEYEWSRSSPSEIAEVVLATTANNEVTNILTRMIGQEIRLTQRGFRTRSATDGYLNSKVYVEGKRRPIQVPDPERAPYYVAMYELRASGLLADQEICDRVNAMGFRTKGQQVWNHAHDEIIGTTGGKLLTPKALRKSISRPVYAGVLCEKWTNGRAIRAAYPGLVSIELYNAANRGLLRIIDQDGELQLVSGKERAPRTRNNSLFPYKHVVMCPHCRRPLSGSSPRGAAGTRYPTYHCSRGHKYWGVPKETLESSLRLFTAKLSFPSACFSRLHKILTDCFHEEQGRLEELNESIRGSISELELRKNMAIRAFVSATSDVMRSALEAQVAALEQELQSAMSGSAALNTSEQELQTFISDARIVLEHPSILLESEANPDEKRALYSFVFDQFPTYEELTLGTAKQCWIYSVLSSDSAHETTLVNPRRVTWNEIHDHIVRWRSVRPTLKLTLEKYSGKPVERPDDAPGSPEVPKS